MGNNRKQNGDSADRSNSAQGFKIKLPDSVVPIPTTNLKNIPEKDSVELWLVQVPRGFDVTKLDKVNAGLFTINGSQSLKVKVNQDEDNKQKHPGRPGEDQRSSKKYFTLHSYRDSPSCQNMTTVVHKSQEVVLGRDLQHMLVVSERVKPPQLEAPPISPSPRKPVPMPTGLQVRCTTFGTRTPCPSAPKTSKKRKRQSTLSEEEHQSSKKRRKDSLSKSSSPASELMPPTPEATPSPKYRHASPVTPDHCSMFEAERSSPEVSSRKKHKKHKHKDSRWSSPPPPPSFPSHSSQSQDSILTPHDTLLQVSPSKSARRTWNASFNEQAHTPGKEKKLIKSASSDSGVFMNGDAGDVSRNAETSPRKKKPHKRSRTEEEEGGEAAATQTPSSGVEGLFVVDRLGDSRTSGVEDSPASSKKHKKKSKKEKK